MIAIIRAFTGAGDTILKEYDPELFAGGLELEQLVVAGLRHLLFLNDGGMLGVAERSCGGL